MAVCMAQEMWSCCHSAGGWARLVPRVAVFTAWESQGWCQPPGDWDWVPVHCLYSLKGLGAGPGWVGRARSLVLIGQQKIPKWHLPAPVLLL